MRVYHFKNVSQTITDKSMSKESQDFGAKVVSMLEQANSDIIVIELSVAA